MKKNLVSSLWRSRAVSAAIAFAFTAGQAQAIGTEPSVVSGQVGFSTQGGALSITNSPGAIINWQGFSIGASETTRFIQQSAASSVLNRVIGPDPSVILGTLTSNGRVFLINPSGILVGQGARIDVAGLVASTLNLSNQDFLAGRLNFASNPLAGKVENQGSITTPSGGSVYLVGANVTNSGIINSPQGDVILAAGQSVKIFDTSTPGVRVEVTASDNAAVNLGEILVRSGQVGIYGAALGNAGIIDANQVVRDASGKIVLRAKQDVTLAAGSRLRASGGQGGEITVQSEAGTTLVSGTIEANGAGEVAGTGGTVQLLGKRVGLITASVEASGTAGGGTVLVGGDYQGTGAVQHASSTYMSSDSTISADAGNNGNGGKVILWSDGFTNVHGTIMARGGAKSGDGGFIETSGHQILDATGVRGGAGAPHGKNGLWLFDPDSNILINGGVTTTVTGSPNFSPTADTTNLLNTDITGLLNGGTDVTVITTNNVGGAHPSDGTQVGDITVAAAITTTAGGARTLTLNSGSGGGLLGVGGSVIIDSTISATGVGNSLAVNLINTTASGGVSFTANGNITTAGGNIQVQANTGGVTQNAASTLNSGAGTITVTSPAGITVGGALTSSNGTGNAIVVKAGNGTAAGTATGGDISITTGTIGLTGGGGAVLYTGNLSSTGVVAAAGGSGSGRFRYNSSPTTQNYSLALNAAAVSAVFREAATPLTVTANNASKTYGASDPAQSFAPVTGYINGDSAGLTGTYARTAGETVAGGPYGITVGTLASDVGYGITFTGGKTLTITKAHLTVTADNQSRLYGDANPALTATLSGFKNGEILSTSGVTGSAAVTTAATASTAVGNVAITDSVGTLLAGNYDFTTFTPGTLTINKAALSVTANPASKTYDGLAYSGGNGVTFSSFKNSETAAVLGGTLAYSGTSQGAVNVGSYLITPGGLTSSNYDISFVDGTLSVIAAGLHAISLNGTRAYDGTVNVAANIFTLSGLVSGEHLTLTGIGTVADPNVGANKPVTLGSLALGNGTNGLASNYTFAGGTQTASITQAPLSVTANPASKTYDGAAYSGGNGVSYGGFVNSEGTGVLGGTLTYGGNAQGAVNAGSYLITPAGLTSGNYAISFINGIRSVDPAPLAVASLSIAANAAVKTYDGLAYRGGNGVTYTGFQGTDTAASLSGTLSYGGNSQGAVNVGYYTIIPFGQSSSNYTITYVNGRLSVIPAALGIAANSVTRLYGDANPVFSATYSGLQNGETAAVLTGSLAFATPATPTANVGNYAIIPSGQSSTNYTISYVNGTLGVIPAALGIAANGTSKTYGSTVSFSGSEFSSTGLKNGETIGSVQLASAGAVSTAGVAGSPYDITASAASGGSFKPGNYNISYVDGSLGVIPVGLLGIAANAAVKTYDGLAYRGGNSVTYTGFQGADTAASLTGTLSYGGNSQGAVNVGNYAIVPSGQSSSNYTITYINGRLSVIPAPLGIAANGATRLYGAANPAFSATYTGFKNGETAAALTGSLAFATPAIVTSNVGNYAIVPSGQSSINYTITYVNGALGVTPAPLGIAANSTSKTYGSTVSFSGSEFSSSGLKNGETVGSVSLTSAGTAATAGVAGSPYDIRASSASGGSFNPGNYAISYVAGALGVIPAPLVIVANSATRLFGNANPAFSAIYTGFKNGETDAVLTGALSLTTPATLTSGIGNYPIVPSGQSSMNYNIAYVDGTLGVTLGFNAEQVIYAGEVNNKFYYRPSSFWHIALSSDNADPGFDVMRGTEDSDSRLNRRANNCDSVSGGGFCETWSFPQQFRKGVKK
ncbi:MAG: MBG domain-containing protein [Proteobacteria bacterium]|nr:MBG domain-containing protein [Pseudomonadota bacterium]